MVANSVPLLRHYGAQVLAAILAALSLFVALRARPLPAVTTSAASGLMPLRFDDLSEFEPKYARANHELLWSDDFNAPPSVTRSGRYGAYLTLEARAPRYDARGGVDRTGAVRIDWNAVDPAQTNCADDSHLIEASFPAVRELYVSFSVRYTPAFVFDWRGRARCDGNAKKLFLLWARDGSRFVLISENGTLGVGSDHDHPLLAQNRDASVTPAALADGKWHRITLRIRQASTPSRADGMVQGWIDGVLRWEYDGIVTHNSGGYYLFKMPATFNAGSPVAQSEWLDDLEIWRSR